MRKRAASRLKRSKPTRHPTYLVLAKYAHTIGKENRPGRQTVAEYVRGQLDRLGIGTEMEAIRWKSKRIDLPPSRMAETG